jgi:two-component system chemotaxis sensor kinase CheA
MTQSIVATYVQEATEILEGLEATLLELEVRPDPDKVDEVFRGLHTVKGSGAMFGFEALARFTHHFESAFERVREGSLRIDRPLIDLALAARDRMAAFLALGSDGPQAEALAAEPATLSILARLAELTGAEAPPAPGHPAPAAPAAGRKRRFDIRFTPLPNAIRNGMKPELLLSELAELGRLEVRYLTGSVPPLQELVPDESALGYWLTVETESGRDAIDEVFIFASDSDLAITEIEDPADAPEDARPRTEAEAPPPVRNASSENVRVPAKRLDEMMDQLGELVIAQSRLQQICDNIGDPALEAIVEEMQRLVTSLRDSTLSIRMLPIEMVFDKFRRVVRTLSAELGKDVELEVAGGETEVGQERHRQPVRAARSYDPQLIGPRAEPAEARLAAGKPARGRLRLSAHQEGGVILISVEDDGRGLEHRGHPRPRRRTRADPGGRRGLRA